MKKLLLSLLLFPILASSQPLFTPEQCGSFQAAIDSAVKYSGDVFAGGRYLITKPLIAAKWDSAKNNYVTFTVRIFGGATFWDGNYYSVITATFKDGPILAIHRGKGCVIQGLTIKGAYRTPVMSDSAFYNSKFAEYGDPTCRDKPFSPYAAIVIDPFRSSLPPDGGYPTLQEYYRGLGGSGGSTGIRIQDCTVDNVTVGIILSPNGQTANCENMKIYNIRSYNTKATFVGCQAQEKSNEITGLYVWGRTHTVLQFRGYGTGTPGLYFIENVQTAGGVVRLIDRQSGGYYPISIKKVFCESLGSIGNWSTNLTDNLENATINLVYPSIKKAYSSGGDMIGGGVTLENCLIRYYGQPKLPILFTGNYYFVGHNMADKPIITGARANEQNHGYSTVGIGYSFGKTSPVKLPPGTNIILADTNSYPIKGVCTIAADSISFVHYPANLPQGLKVAVFKVL